MKIIKVECCQGCPYCILVGIYKHRCEKYNIRYLTDLNNIHPDCKLEDYEDVSKLKEELRQQIEIKELIKRDRKDKENFISMLCESSEKDKIEIKRLREMLSREDKMTKEEIINKLTQIIKTKLSGYTLDIMDTSSLIYDWFEETIIKPKDESFNIEYTKERKVYSEMCVAKDIEINGLKEQIKRSKELGHNVMYPDSYSD